MPWSEDSIAYAVATNIFPWRRYVTVPNVSWGLLSHEADLVALSDAGWLSEVEIKVTKADFLADREKHRHKLSASHGQPELISAFYYAMPSAIWNKCQPEDLPPGAGLILVGDDYHRAREARAYIAQKPTSNAVARRLTAEEREQLLRLGYIRYWGRQEAVDRLLSGILREAERLTAAAPGKGER